MLKTWNNTCASTTLTGNTRKKIVKIEIIIIVVTQNVKILKDCIKVQEKKKKVIVLCSRPPQNVKLGIFK